MAEKDLSYRLTADQRDFERGFKSAEASARAMERELARLEAQQARVERAMDQVGAGMLAGGAAIMAGLALATKAAVSWETAWTGVAKVIDGSPEQLADLESELRGLARTLPQTHEEIAGVAAAAGQLGVAREHITRFTRVMVDLGTATNLTSEEAAFALARLMNIMQTAPGEVDRLGAAIVDLGNNSATTEADIVEMALRIAGAGHTVRMSEADVLSFATALSSVGVQAEAGGSAISRAFIIIEGAVRSGGRDLQRFAAVSGMTADEFRAAWQQDAARATAVFIEGLGRMQKSGGDVFATLRELGMSEILLRDAMLRLAGAGDLVSRTLDIGNRGWEENAALLEEAQRRYATVESRVQIARNSINDLAIDIGNSFLPAVGEGADLVANFAEVLGALPGPVKTMVAVLAAAAGGVLLLGGAALVAVPRIAAMKAAIDTLAAAEGRLAAATVRTTGALGRVGSFLAGPWGVAIGVAIAALTAFGVAHAEARGRAKQLADTLDEQSGAVTRETALWIANELAQRGVIENADLLGISAADLTRAIMGEADAVARVNAELAQHNGAVAPEYARRSGDKAAAAANVRKALGELGGDLEASRELHDQLGRAQEGQTKSTQDLDPATRRLADGLGLTADAAETLAGEVDALDKEFRALFQQLFGVEEAQDAAVRAMQRMTEEAKRNGGALKGNSEAAVTNRENVRRLIQAHMDQVMAMARTGATSEELEQKTQELKQAFVAQARQAGLTESEIQRYAASYDEVPAVVQTTIKVDTSTAMTRARQLANYLRNIPDEHINVAIRITGASPSAAAAAIRKQYANRWGGLYEGPYKHAQVGILREAEIASPAAPARYAWAEPATGGELFAPRFGDLNRTRQLVSYAIENWWGGWKNFLPSPSPGAASTARPSGQPAGGAMTLRVVVDDGAVRGLVRVEVDDAVGALADAVVYQTT